MKYSGDIEFTVVNKSDNVISIQLADADNLLPMTSITGVEFDIPADPGGTLVLSGGPISNTPNWMRYRKNKNDIQFLTVTLALANRGIPTGTHTATMKFIDPNYPDGITVDNNITVTVI